MKENSRFHFFSLNLDVLYIDFRTRTNISLNRLLGWTFRPRYCILLRFCRCWSTRPEVFSCCLITRHCLAADCEHGWHETWTCFVAWRFWKEASSSSRQWKTQWWFQVLHYKDWKSIFVEVLFHSKPTIPKRQYLFWWEFIVFFQAKSTWSNFRSTTRRCST